MKTLRKAYIIIFLLFSVHLYSQDASFTYDTLQISSYLIQFEAAYSDSTAYSFLWNFGDGETSTDSIISHKYSDAGTYTVSLTVTLDSTGAFDVVSQNITVIDVFEVPNVFTPNDDSMNDFFIVRSNGVTNINIQIFNRTGVLVYKSTAPVIVWDGRNLSGVEVGPGVYYYIISSDDVFYEKTGFLQLIR